MMTRHYFVLIALLLAAHVTGCTSARPAPVARPSAVQIAPPARPDTARTPPAGILSGIGSVFSTPAGIARRQAVRLAKAAVPKKIGKGAVYAPKATEVVNAFKPRAAVINADSGAIVTAIGKNKASAATAPGATAMTTTSKGINWWWVLLALPPLAWWGFKKIAIPFS